MVHYLDGEKMMMSYECKKIMICEEIGDDDSK